MQRTAQVYRKTKETEISIKLTIDGEGKPNISTGIPFFDHMLFLFSAHGFFDLLIKAEGDLSVDFHHTVEDVGLVLGEAFDEALGERKGIRRYGQATLPMDDALAMVAVDLSRRPYLVYNVPRIASAPGLFDIGLAKEFFRAFANQAGMNLHINVYYGENEHHVLESIFKAAGRSIDQAVSIDERIRGVCSTKGIL